VRLHKRHIGVITRLAATAAFAFEQEYIDDPKRPTLSLSFKGSTGGLVTQTRPTARRVPPFFSNLLPEGHLRDYLAKRADVNPEREFFLLTVLGADLPGALSLRRLRVRRRGQRLIMIMTMSTTMRTTANNRWRFFSRRSAVEILGRHGGLWRPDHSCGRMGGSWIVKLPSARYKAVPENEFAMMELARRVGISVPENKLVDIASIKGLPEQAHTVEGRALAVKRFGPKAGWGARSYGGFRTSLRGISQRQV